MGNFVIHPDDSVAVDLQTGQKYARRAIKAGDPVIKYGFPIGIAAVDIGIGEHVHTQNLISALNGTKDYVYSPSALQRSPIQPVSVQAYVRKNGAVGIRNDVWIINTVACVNKTAEKLAKLTGAFCFPHPYGCSQLGGDMERTLRILCGLIRHPNAGGVLVLGLGCENGNISELKQYLEKYDPERIRFLNTQDCTDEIAEGVSILKELKALAASDRRETVSIEKLKIGLKCGGSDGLSGITANPMVGSVTDRITSMGAAAVLTEVPEMFGAEQILFDRCVSEDIFQRAVSLVNGYKSYFVSHGQPVNENPSPGNKAGGITTLEEKSLGCVQKGGTAPVTAVLDYGETADTPGLQLLNGPGNDPVAVTNLTATGCHLILFTTGRGTPLGAPVPTLKISTNTDLFRKKPHWIDYDAMAGSPETLFTLILQTVNGKQTKNEENGYREIAIFKDGVTL